MQNTTDARLIYAHFKRLPGSDYIATEHAVMGLIKWLKKRKPKLVLEVGAGIGTLTFAAVSALSETRPAGAGAAYRLISVEHNDFCLAQLRENLKEQWGRFELLTDMPAASADSPAFDFVIIDGGNQNPDFITHLSPRAVVFIEGYMDKKHRLIENTHKQRSWVKTNFRSADRKASYWIFQFEPAYGERAWFFANNLYNRLRSGLKRRLSMLVTEKQASPRDLSR